MVNNALQWFDFHVVGKTFSMSGEPDQDFNSIPGPGAGGAQEDTRDAQDRGESLMYGYNL